MKIDKYYWRAQYLPAVLTSLPLMMFFDEVLVHSNWWRPSADILAFIKFAPAAFSAGLSFWMTQVNAYISKQLFQAKPEFLPTTYRLLYSNSLLGRKTKKELHQKIVTDFGVKLLTEQQELADPVEARKIVASVVPRIRLKMRKDVFVRRRNISYGFARNMVGGSVFAGAIAVLMSFYQYQMGGLQVGMAISLSLIYGIIAFLGRFIIRRAGEEYAETLVDHYLAEDKIADISA